MRHLRVKVCGITCLDDALWAADAGADALGLIFVEGTPRYVAPAVAAAIVAGLPPLVCPVGVFWDHSPAQVAAVVAECGLGAVQLHGAEPPDIVAAMPRPVLKTIKVRERGDLAQLDRYKPAAFLLDSPARWSEGEARALEVPRGSLVVFSDYLPHYSSQNRSEYSRQAFSMHFAEAASAWSPSNWLQRPTLAPFRL